MRRTETLPGWIDEGFAAAYGGAPTGRWAAPGRVNLIGEHTDYNDGLVLPFALPLRVVVAARLRRDGRLLARSAQQPDEPLEAAVEALAPGSVGGWAAYVAGVVWALGQAGHRVPGAELFLDGDVPTGGGLSSSAALECAVVHALDDLLGLGLPRTEQAELARRAENDFVGAPTGILDQMASLLCTAGSALFLDTRTRRSELVPLDLPAAGLAVLVIDTRVHHAHTESGYGERRATCEAAARTLGVTALGDIPFSGLDATLARLGDEVMRRRLRHVVTENDRVVQVVARLRDGRPGDIGPLLTASHVSLRDDYEVSSPELDTAVDAALGAGALGARMTGGGFGGSAIALVASRHQEAVEEQVRQVFRRAGFGPPGLLVAVPSQGARRLTDSPPSLPDHGAMDPVGRRRWPWRLGWGFTGTVTAHEQHQQRRADLRAAVEARRDLGPDYEPALIDSFLDKVERDLDQRVEARLATEKTRKPGPDNSLPVALGSLGMGIPLSGIAGGTGGLGGLLTAWAGIVGVNVAYAWGRRRARH